MAVVLVTVVLDESLLVLSAVSDANQVRTGHAVAPSYAETDWPAILRLYDALLTLHRSPVYLLNRAIVVAQIEGPHAGIRALGEAGRDAALRRYHLFDATLGELYRRAGDFDHARRHFDAAKEKTQSPFDREIIDRRLAKCS